MAEAWRGWVAVPAGHQTPEGAGVTDAFGSRGAALLGEGLQAMAGLFGNQIGSIVCHFTEDAPAIFPGKKVEKTSYFFQGTLSDILEPSKGGSIP